MLLALIITTTGCPPQGAPATPADFYKGKTIDLTTTGAAGSFNDLNARIIATYLSRDTGANVTVTDRSGAGGLEGINYVYKARPDGLTLGTVASVKFVANKVMAEPAAVYEIENFSYIMRVDRQPYCFFVSPDGPYQSVADLQAGEALNIGGGGPSGSVSLGGLTVIKLLGLDARVITGLRPEAARALAVERGEIIGYCLNIPNARPGIEAGMIEPIFMLTTERNPLAPDVPAISELVSLTGEDLALVNLWETAFVASNLFLAPPGIPEDRLAFLRDLADRWAQDEGFLEETNRAAGYEVQIYLTGEEVSQTIMETVAKLDEFKAIFTELIEQYRA